MNAKTKILKLVEQFPDVVTFDEAVAKFASLCEELPEAARKISARASKEEMPAFTLSREQIAEVMDRLPDKLTYERAFDEASYRLFILFRIEMGLEEASKGGGIISLTSQAV